MSFCHLAVKLVDETDVRGSEQHTTILPASLKTPEKLAHNNSQHTQR